MTRLGMKQFEKMGWIRQGFLGLIVCTVMSPSHAMSVRERYLLQHPQAAAQQDVEKFAPPVEIVKHARKNRTVEKVTPVRQKASHRRHAIVEQVVEKKSATKHSRLHTAKSRHERVIVPKIAKPKFSRQQAREAEAALKHRSVKVKQEARVTRHRHQVEQTEKTKHIQVAKKEVLKHVRHTATKKHPRHQ
ncbi:MAG: hypothetical protein H7Z73_03780 [Candidatus Saccharibacteria bacterium]|nr:hypothetical protein [Moraxellaceae bacterium]